MKTTVVRLCTIVAYGLLHFKSLQWVNHAAVVGVYSDTVPFRVSKETLCLGYTGA